MKVKYDLPTQAFPFKIQKRLNSLSVPRKLIIDTGHCMPAYTPRGIRKSALRSQITDRVNDIACPYLRKVLIQKKVYKNRFNADRIAYLDKLIEAANGTAYSKLANCVIDLKRDSKDVKKKKGWTESEWKKHMDYIGQIAGPKSNFEPPPVKRGPRKPITDLLPRIAVISSLPDSKMYKRLSQEGWYKNPMKVSPAAIKYVITDRTKTLAAHRVYAQPD